MCAEVFDDDVDVGVVETLLEQVLVAFAHVFAGVVVGAAGDHGQEADLLGALAVHVDAVEEAGDAVVAEHLAVEDVDSGLDGGFAAKLLIESGHVCCSPVAGLPDGKPASEMPVWTPRIVIVNKRNDR